MVTGEGVCREGHSRVMAGGEERALPVFGGWRWGGMLGGGGGGGCCRGRGGDEGWGGEEGECCSVLGRGLETFFKRLKG